MVIVGSGVSGLTSAIILAREGWRTLVVEQAPQCGGLMQNYYRRDRSCPTGVHTLGALDEGQILWRYLKYLNVLGRLQLSRLDDEAFHEYRFADQSFLLPQGHAAASEALRSAFPRQRAAIDQYFAEMRRTAAQFQYYNLSQEPTEAAWLSRENLAEYLECLTDSVELRAVLSAVNPLYGVEPAACPLQLHFLVMDSILRSAHRVDEDHMPLAQAYAESLRAAGGELRTRSRLTQIAVSERQVTGVELQDGDVVRTKHVIFTGHPRHLLNLCAPELFRPTFRKRVRALPDTMSPFAVALRAQVRQRAANRDLIIYRDFDTSSLYGAPREDSGPSMVYCTVAPSQRTDDLSISAMCLSPYEDWSAWWSSTVDNRPDDYHAAKQRLADDVLEVARPALDAVATQLEVIDSFTPLTIRDYTLAPGGTCYGIKKTLHSGRFAFFPAHTGVGGLLLAGQSILLPGILGSLISGVRACAVLLGVDYLFDKIRRNSQ